MVTVSTHDATMYLPLAELVDIEKELERIQKELTKAPGEPGAHREEAAERELRVQGPRGGGQRRAGEGR